MTTKQKNIGGKPTGVKAFRLSSEQDFTCSEAQLDNLLSEGESTGQAGVVSRDPSKRDVAARRKPK